MDSPPSYPNAVIYLTFLTLYLVVFIGYSFRQYEDEDEQDDKDSWSSLWETPSHRNKIGLLADGVVKAKVDNRSSMKRVSSTAKRLFSAAMKSNASQSKAKLAWELINKNDSSVPLVCFVNSKSGGQQGSYVLASLQALLSKYQVFDLSKVDPIAILAEYSKLSTCRVLVAGGDGTANWVLDAIDTIIWPHSGPPAVAILPIGTGNDLANHFGWLSYFEEHTVSPKVLLDVLRAEKLKMDRWKVSFQFSYLSAAPASVDSKKPRLFSNYFGLGIDASIVHQFHYLRKERPNLFFHSNVNKLFYGMLGWQAIWRTTDLMKIITSCRLFCDGQEVPIPSDSQGIVLANISSYAGGSVLWAPDEGTFAPQAAGDGLIEVVAVRSSFELAQVKLGVAHCQCLCQGKVVEIRMEQMNGLAALPVQLDGEPFLLKELVDMSKKGMVSIRIDAMDKQAEMLQAPADRSAYETVMEASQSSEVDVKSMMQWAAEQQIITAKQQDAVLKEYQSRLSRMISMEDLEDLAL